MSYGIRLRNAAGSILMELTGQSARTVYRQSLGAITNGMTVTVPGFRSCARCCVHHCERKRIR